MLTSSNEYSRIFLATNRLLLDSCVLNDLATDERTQNVLARARTLHSFVYCTVSLLEVGFGPIAKVAPEQNDLAMTIYAGDRIVRADTHFFAEQEMRKAADIPGTIYSYNPCHQEWFAARHKLMSAMDILKIGGSRARALSNDAIIYSSGWNSHSTIITNNAKDFDIFNQVSSEREARHLLPIFTLDDLEQSFEQDVSFPENRTQQA